MRSCCIDVIVVCIHGGQGTHEKYRYGDSPDMIENDCMWSWQGYWVSCEEETEFPGQQDIPSSSS